MPYFSYHGRNKKLIKEGFLKNYFFEDDGVYNFLILIFADGRRFPIREERWMEYEELIHKYYERGNISEKNN